MCTPLFDGAIIGGISDTATLNFSEVRVYEELSIQRFFISSRNDSNVGGEVSGFNSVNKKDFPLDPGCARDSPRTWLHKPQFVSVGSNISGHPFSFRRVVTWVRCQQRETLVHREWFLDIVCHFKMFAFELFQFLTVCENSSLVLARLMVTDFAIIIYDDQTSIIMGACVCRID